MRKNNRDHEEKRRCANFWLDLRQSSAFFSFVEEEEEEAWEEEEEEWEEEEEEEWEEE